MEWVKVEDGMPELNQLVLVMAYIPEHCKRYKKKGTSYVPCDDGVKGELFIAMFASYSDLFDSKTYYEWLLKSVADQTYTGQSFRPNYGYCVTHWMALPEAPK